MKTLHYLQMIFFIIISLHITAQTKEFKFGKFEITELQSTKCKIDSDANAYVIGDYGYTTFDYSDNNGFQLVFNRHTRIKILKKASFELANFEVELYKSGKNEESISELKGITYNLEDGKIVTSKLDKKSIFKQEIDEHRNSVKFTMPNVKEGCIIEVYYEIKSDFWSIPKWQFQEMVPVLYSQYIMHIPEYLNYKFFQNGYQQIQQFKKSESTSFNYTWNEVDQVGMRIPNSTHIEKIDYMANIYTYIGKDIKAFHDEPYMTSRSNYLSSLDVELQSTSFPHSLMKIYASDWKSITQELLKNEYFGNIIQRQNPTNQIINTATKGITDPLKKAIAIYEYIRDNFKWNEANRKYASKGIRKIIDDRSGNSADLNLLLIAALRNADLKAEPVVLSTRDNGRIITEYPMLQKLNYVIAQLNIGDQQFLLDVTDKYAPFGFLPEKCLNGQGRIISDQQFGDVELSTKTNYLSNINISATLGENGEVIGKWTEINKGYAANTLRKNLGASKSKDDYIQDFQKKYPSFTINNYSFENLDSLHREVINKYDFTITSGVEITGNLMMMHPLLIEQLEENIFKSQERQFPVDYSFITSKTYIITLEIPKGYKVETLPKSISLSLPGKEASFMYSTNMIENKIQMIRKFSINKTMFLVDDYSSLKDFYKLRVSKEAEVIVLKKI